MLQNSEDLLNEAISEEKIKKLNLKMLSEAECYKTLLQRKDSKLKLAVLYLIEKTNDSKYKPLVELVLNDTNKNIRKKASEILNKK